MSVRFSHSWKAIVAAVAVAVGGNALALSAQAHERVLPNVESQDDEGFEPHAGMMRYPDVSATQIVFEYANDLWVAPREGGQALPLASPPGSEQFPRFSADGKTIAFMGNYDGNRDLYTVPVAGGVPERVTYHPSGEALCDWTPDGDLLYYTNAFSKLRRQTQLMTVAAEGGLPEILPVPYGANGAISDDGKFLAYTPHTRDARTWKRYRGGMATDIWVFNLEDKTSQKVTDWEGTDTLPMWHGKKLYYLSDQGSSHRLNVWCYDTETGARDQITQVDDYDVKWPSIGPGPSGGGEIIFQYGPTLASVDLTSRETRTITVTIPGARATLREKSVEAKDFLAGGDISSTGKRVVVEARGDIWTLPAENGAPRNLTETDGTAERSPSWSPDGRWIAYFSDATGEYELYITQSDGLGETRQLTEGSQTYYYNPLWSPDSKQIAFTDKAGKIFVLEVESKDLKQIDMNPFPGQPQLDWAHDSSWLAYTRAAENQLSVICLYNVAEGKSYQVTSGMFNDSSPAFDREGKYLYFATNRTFTSPIYEDLGTSFVYGNTGSIVAVPLSADTPLPWAPESDEEEFTKDEDKDDDDASDDADDDKSDDDADDDDAADDQQDADDGDQDEEGDDEEGDDEEEDESLKIDLDGFEARAFQLPMSAGNFGNLASPKSGVVMYVRTSSRGITAPPQLQMFDLSKKKEDTILAGIGGFGLSADGKKAVVLQGGGLGIMTPAPGQKPTAVPMDDMVTNISPRDEWNQIFVDAWRIQRDFFYDPTMHGVDWNNVREQYEAMLADCTVREDVAYVIGEMISELNVGHAYVRGAGDVEDEPAVSVGLLGVDFAEKDGAIQIAKIYQGADWDVDARGPLSQPGVNVSEGDYLLAVNGRKLAAGEDPYAAFQGLAGKVTTLMVSDKPELDDDARKVHVTPMGNETNLRYRAFIEANRKYVEEKTDGKVGYIYVPDTGVNGQNDLVRQFYGQTSKAALIIDERWNGGGQIPTRFIELLNRPVTNYWARRDGEDWKWPPDSHQGPKCMLINGLAGSGGDAFPAYFRQAGLGKLIGMRTWGGLVGISGNPQLIDGGAVSAPTFAFYEKDGTWGIEGHGVEPDIEVVDDPAEMQDGNDPQLNTAIEHMLAEIQANPYVPPKRPAYPDRSGFGITDDDK